MNQAVLDAEYRASHEVELPLSELKILEQGAADIIASFVEQITFLKRNLSASEARVDQLEGLLKLHGVAWGEEEGGEAS